jgi:hypothetical protein
MIEKNRQALIDSASGRFNQSETLRTRERRHPDVSENLWSEGREGEYFRMIPSIFFAVKERKMPYAVDEKKKDSG